MKRNSVLLLMLALGWLASTPPIRAGSIPNPECYYLDCPERIVVPCQGPGGTRVWYSATVSNLCAGVPNATLQYSIPPGSLFPSGSSNVVCVTAFVNNQPVQRCCFVVIVDNCCPPSCLELFCPPPLILNCTTTPFGPGVLIPDNNLPRPTPTNHCGPLPELQLRRFPPEPATGGPTFFPPGTNDLIWCMTDGRGQTNCCVVQVIVLCPVVPENCRPQILCPPNIVVACETPLGAVVEFPKPRIRNCDRPVNVTFSVPPGSVFPVGTTPVVVCLSWLDPITNTQQTDCCTFQVTVRCCPPSNCYEVLCPPDIRVPCNGPEGTRVTYQARVINKCPGTPDPTLEYSIPPGSLFPPGTNIVCVFAKLPTGQDVAHCCFRVIVEDNCPTNCLELICPPNIIKHCETTPFGPGVVVTAANLPQPNITNHCGPLPTTLNWRLLSPTPIAPGQFYFPPGSNVVAWCVTDGKTFTNCCKYLVVVQGCPPPDECRPQLRCPPDVVVECQNSDGAKVNFPPVQVFTNHCPIPIPVTVVYSIPSGSFFPLGKTTVIACIAWIDPSTGEAKRECCDFDVIVRCDRPNDCVGDKVPPVIHCPSNIVMFCAGPNGALVPFDVRATDNCDPAPTITITPPPGRFPLGCTTVVVIAKDAAGNESRCEFTVCVLPRACFIRNPSFEIVVPNAPPPGACGDLVNLAPGWTALAGTPDLFRPAAGVPANCYGVEQPCHGSNYAGLAGGYIPLASGPLFQSDQMMATLSAPLFNGQLYLLRSCLSLAETSSAPVLIEFVLTDSANLAAQQVVHQVWVQQKVSWQKVQPPCFRVPLQGRWDRLIIRPAKVGPGVAPYPPGYVYVDNVNICCCGAYIQKPTLTPSGLNLHWDGPGVVRTNRNLGDPNGWGIVPLQPTMDAEGNSSILLPTTTGFFDVFFDIQAADPPQENCLTCPEP